MRRAEQGLGTVRTVRSRATGKIIGYRALLPRELSQKGRGKKPSPHYQEPIGALCRSEDEARRLLAAVLEQKQCPDAVRHGLPFSSLVAAELRAQLAEARRKYSTEARANKAIAKLRSIDRRWLVDAPFYEFPVEAIELSDLQGWIDALRDEAEGQSGEPLSASFVRSVGQVLKAAMGRAPGGNIARAIELPGRSRAEIAYLSIGPQRALFGASDGRISLEDRVMVGCGMGPGLRVGELLSFERHDVQLDARDPHLMVRYGGPDRSPPKGGEVRRVELYEPALGFWRLWMRDFYRGGIRVFPGPSGGYQKAWPERFPAWAEVAGVPRLSSHVMRHTFAVAMLSGTWGYEPRSMEFVSKQLGHADITTTQRYYAAFEFGVWQREVRRMTGRDPVLRTEPVTALELLGLDASGDASSGGGGLKLAVGGDSWEEPRHPPKHRESSRKTGPADALTHQLRAELDAALQATRDGDPHAGRKLVEACSAARDYFDRLAEEERAAAFAEMGSRC